MEGTPLEPRDLLAPGGDGTEQEDGWRPELLAFDLLRKRSQRRQHGPLAWQRPALDRGGRLAGIASSVHQTFRDLAQVLHAHVEDERAGKARERTPVERRLWLLGILVPRHERNGRGVVAMGDRDARVSRGSDAGGDAGHDLEIDAGGRARLCFLAATPEDE